MARPPRRPRPTSFAAWRAGFRTRALAQGIRPRSSTPPSRASASTPRWSGSTAARPSSPSRSGNTSTAPPRRPGSRPAAPSAPSSTRPSPPSRAATASTARWCWRSGAWRPTTARNRGSMPVIESLATLAYEGRRRDFAEEQLIAALRILQAGDVAPGAHARLLGRRHGPHPVHADELPRLRRRLHRRRPPRHLVRRPDRRARLGRQLPRPLRLAPRPALGRRGAAAGGLQLRQRRPVEPPPGRRLARPRRDPDRRLSRCPTTARRRSSRPPAPAARPSPSTRTSSSSRTTTTPPPTRWASATSATASSAAAHRRRLAARRARALAHREDRAAGAADRPRLRRPARPTA